MKGTRPASPCSGKAEVSLQALVSESLKSSSVLLDSWTAAFIYMSSVNGLEKITNTGDLPCHCNVHGEAATRARRHSCLGLSLLRQHTSNGHWSEDRFKPNLSRSWSSQSPFACLAT